MVALPQEMTFIDHGTGGAPEIMVAKRGPLPAPAPDELLIRVLATGVNRPDIQQRLGNYPPPPGASPVMGLECAGEVVAVGAAVTRYKPGDRVCALTNGGAYAEYCVAPETQALAWPKGYDALRAAALPETYFTVWANLFGHGRLAKGETVLVHGGTSGIGVTAIKLAKEFGARVFATAGSAEKVAACLKFGADAAIDYKAEDFQDAVKRLTEGKGVDVILDMVGADYFQRNLRSLALDGRLVFIAFLGGFEAAKADLRPIMIKRLTVTGSTMRPRTTAQKAALAKDLAEKVWPALEAGRCGPEIFATFPLSGIVEAHRLMESSQHIGKIMLQVAE
ncbi:NAD(P)H-quinone oxidoreductase [Plastoroseomonas hellenica]|uniref:NAD(P)H-quinone oxidoreductase n=1 Tax=Plastoroseomonas hellenica TaxID=2687306 RepID=UPI001BA7E4E3|nr:NAD(P)H-quinone oxidoreductase [Plastoroseomonas hellenica]MBR0644860.1 NAD(P)H-quinone oxidoreductase [Plastoroseomonas hellenica]